MFCGPIPGLPNSSRACAILIEQLSVAFVQKDSQRVLVKDNTYVQVMTDEKRKAQNKGCENALPGIRRAVI